MNPHQRLQNAIDALLSMKPEEIVSAFLQLELLQTGPPEDLQPLVAELKRATRLARASSELWGEVYLCASINVAGYSPLGVVVPEPHPMGDLRG